MTRKAAYCARCENAIAAKRVPMWIITADGDVRTTIAEVDPEDECSVRCTQTDLWYEMGFRAFASREGAFEQAIDNQRTILSESRAAIARITRSVERAEAEIDRLVAERDAE